MSLSPFPPGLPRLRRAAARHVAAFAPTALATWGQPPSAGSTDFTSAGQSLVAGVCRWALPDTATRPINRLSSFAGNWLLISPDGLIDDGLLREIDVARPLLPGHARRLRRRDPVQSSGCSKRPGPTSAPGPVTRPEARFRAVLQRAGALAGGLRLVPALKAKHNGAHYLDWPTELVQRIRLPWPRPGASWQARSIRFALRSSCCSARRNASRNMPTPRVCA